MRRLAAALLSALLAAAGMPILGTAAGGCFRAAAGASVGSPASGAPAADSPAAHRVHRAQGAPGSAAAGTAAAGTAAAGHAAAANRHGPGCRMSCCVVRPAAASCACRCGSGQAPRLAGFAAGMPSVLPAPPRLPLPRSAGFEWRRAGLSAALPFLGLPERPPRA